MKFDQNKIVYLIPLTIVACAVFYYLVIFLPSKHKEEQDTQNFQRQQKYKEEAQTLKAKCANDGRKYMDSLDPTEGQILGEPEFYQNNVLNTCLVAFDISDNSSGRMWVNHFVHDVYSNKTLAESYIELIENKEQRKHDRVHRLGLEEDVFFAERERLMTDRIP